MSLPGGSIASNANANPSTVIGFSGCLLALILEMILLALYKGTDNRAGQAAAVSFLFIHVGFYSICIDATTYIYCTEIFPSHLRARGSSLSISGLFFATVIFTCAAPTAFANIGWKYYIVFAITTAMVIVAVWFYWYVQPDGDSGPDHSVPMSRPTPCDQDG